jgi:hypothetical protein
LSPPFRTPKYNIYFLHSTEIVKIDYTTPLHGDYLILFLDRLEKNYFLVFHSCSWTTSNRTFSYTWKYSQHARNSLKKNKNLQRLIMVHPGPYEAKTNPTPSSLLNYFLDYYEQKAMSKPWIPFSIFLINWKTNFSIMHLLWGNFFKIFSDSTLLGATYSCWIYAKLILFSL